MKIDNILNQLNSPNSVVGNKILDEQLKWTAGPKGTVTTQIKCSKDQEDEVRTAIIDSLQLKVGDVLLKRSKQDVEMVEVSIGVRNISYRWKRSKDRALQLAISTGDQMEKLSSKPNLFVRCLGKCWPSSEEKKGNYYRLK
jgi:diphthamide synthase (EF-2-diphthine--ammonia ligase)